VTTNFLDDGEGMLVVDIDGTLCDVKSKGESYADLVPRADMLQKLREYQNRGYRILLYTARNMRTHNHNLGLINKHTAPVMIEWLSKWDIPYDEILFGKPWPRKKGFYIDDRAIRPDEFLKLSEEEIHKLLGSHE
jgi:capsule biosynthesis phosphatase